MKGFADALQPILKHGQSSSQVIWLGSMVTMGVGEGVGVGDGVAVGPRRPDWY